MEAIGYTEEQVRMILAHEPGVFKLSGEFTRTLCFINDDVFIVTDSVGNPIAAWVKPYDIWIVQPDGGVMNGRPLWDGITKHKIVDKRRLCDAYLAGTLEAFNDLLLNE